MSVTYDPTLPSDKDWVRFQVGDRSLTAAVLQDEEIVAILAEEANKYLAAARIGEVVMARLQGVTSKSVGGLSISFGDSEGGNYRDHINRLREKGCQLLLGSDGGGSVLRLL